MTSACSTFSPSSGSVNSVLAMPASSGQDRILPFRIDVKCPHCLVDLPRLDLARATEGAQGRDRDVLGIDFKMAAKSGAGVTAAKPIRPQRDHSSGQPAGNLLAHQAHVVGNRQD